MAKQLPQKKRKTEKCKRLRKPKLRDTDIVTVSSEPVIEIVEAPKLLTFDLPVGVQNELSLQRGAKDHVSKRKPRRSVERATVELKQVFFRAFDLIGGVQELANWATFSNQNQAEFYRLLARMLPREIKAANGGVAPNDLNNLTDDELDDIISSYKGS